MAKKDGRYITRPGAGANTTTTDLVVAPSGSIGRVWAISMFATTAAQTAMTLRSGVSAAGTAIWQMNTSATQGDGNSITFSNGLAFSNGLFIDVTTGAPNVSVCFTIDSRADV